MNNKNVYLDIDIEQDFGFTFSDEEEFTAPINDEVQDLKKRLEAIRKTYMPLLENLSKNADQPIIKWPNRGPILKKHMDKLSKLTEPGFN